MKQEHTEFTPGVLDKMQQELTDLPLYQLAFLHGHSYLEGIQDRVVFPTEAALSALKIFEEPMPEISGHAEEIIKLLADYGAPATVAQVGGRYHGFVNGSVVPAGLAAKLLASFWDQNTAMEVISPLSACLESIVQEWLKALFDLPPTTVAGFVSGSSSANLCGLAAARFRLLHHQGWDINEQGLYQAPPLRIITSRQAHATILKSIGILGLGKQNIEWVDVDTEGRIQPDAVPPLDSRCLLILQAGNVNSGAFDPFEQLCQKAQDAGAWVHIDGAFGLWAQTARELKYLTQGINLAHSWAVDGHKTLNTPYDNGIILCRDEKALCASLHMSGSYMVAGKRDGMYFTPEMSRRARIIELWATLKYLGKAGINELVYTLHQRAVQFATALSQMKGFEVLNEVVFNQVLVRCDRDEETDRVLSYIQEQRVCWVGGSIWQGKKVIRISVCGWTTTEDDVRRSIDAFQRALNTS